MRLAFSSLVLLSIVACGGQSNDIAPAPLPPPPPPAAPAASAVPPEPGARDDGRLPDGVTPVRYAITLRVDPAQPRFSGAATIQVEVTRPTWHVVLNARDMRVTRAAARVGASREIPAGTTTRLAHGGVVPEELVLTFAQPLPAGQALLDLEYDAPFSGDLAGLYRVQEDSRWYAYTQFEATDARRAFPCFDEPSFKTPYDVTILAPAGLSALANVPEVAHAPEGEMVRHTFQTSRPLPSYLVAFAVGDFDFAEGQKAPFAIRVVTTKGRAHLASLALDAAAGIIAKLGEYFDIRYPYEKLDLVAVPDFAAGAMENPGLVTFRDMLLLLDPKQATTSTKRAQAAVIAHEFAHQWFGDLVTAKWWNDIWLNEGFATWAEARIVDTWKPSFGATLEQVAGVQHVMDTDALATARAVREPVHSTGEAMEAFDGITYDKGAAVLRMIEAWLGPDTFRRGVQRYLHDNAWHNATADDLFAALEFVSGQKVRDMASGFLDRPGVPNVTATWSCAPNRGAKVELRQNEWKPLGEPAAGASTAARAWTLPVCIATDTAAKSSCFTLEGEPIVRDVGARCPTWVHPNAGEAGYYRFALDRDKVLALARAAKLLAPADRMGLVSNAWAQVRQGGLAPGALLDMLPALDLDTDRHVVEAIVSALGGYDRALVDEPARAAFRNYVAARFGKRKAMAGWEPRPREDEESALERREVLSAMGRLAEDDATIKEADKYAQKWLKDASSVAGDTAAIAVPLASIRAGQARLDELRTAAKNAKTPEDRVLAIGAMGWFSDPDVLKRALDLMLTPELRLSEMRYLFRSVLARRDGAAAVLAWEKDSWAKLRERVPGSLGHGMLVDPAAHVCTRAKLDEARAFYEPAARGMEGVKRPLDEGLETAGLCVALREHAAPLVTRYFSAR